MTTHHADASALKKKYRSAPTIDDHQAGALAKAQLTGINWYVVRDPTTNTLDVICCNDYTNKSRRHTIEFVAFGDRRRI